MLDRPATIRDVARSAGLSVASVSRVLNRHDNVHPDTRDRVLEAVRLLGYVPNATARSLSTARSHAIGVVLPDLHGEFFSEMVRGMDRIASENGYMLLLSNIHADPLLAGQAMAAMRGRVDGMVVMAPQIGERDLATLLRPGTPVVLVNCPDEPGFPAIRLDNRAGVGRMVRHLVDQGRRRIVHLSGPTSNVDGAERRDAFAESMAAMTGERDPLIVEGDFMPESGGRLVADLIAQGVDFDAIFAANDMMAMGVLMALRDAGRSVPGQVAVAGYDDIPLARYLGLTTIRCDMVGTGALAIRRLLERIGTPPTESTLDLITPDLIVRDTTRPT